MSTYVSDRRAGITAARLRGAAAHDGALRAGLSDAAPFAVGLVPLGIMLGVAVDASSLPDGVGLLLSFLVSAGASQFATMSIVDGGGSLLTAVLAGLVINARLLMYAAALAPRFADQPAWFRWAGPHTIVDQTFALVSTREERHPGWFRRYWLGASGLLLALYLGGILLGIVAGQVVPAGLSLEFTIPVLFLAMLMPGLRDTPRRGAALAAAVVTVATLDLPHGLGLLLGALAGAITGASVARRRTP